MEGTYNVYALSVDGSSFRYVGSTKYEDVGRRARQYFCQRFARSNPVFLWVRREAEKGNRVRATLLGGGYDDPDRVMEQWWIEKLHGDGHDLINVHDGGLRGYRSNTSWNRGLKTGKPSEATRKKISATLMGNVPYNKGKKLSAEHVEKMRGRPVSDETRARMRASRLAFLERSKQGKSQ